MAKPYRFLKDKKKNDFLNALLKCGLRNRAAEMAGITRQSHYLWIKTDDEYAMAYEKVRQMLIDTLEDAAYERAVNGIERKIYFKGEEIGTQMEYSDPLLALLLKANMPEKYKDKTETTVSVDDGAGVIDWEEDAVEEDNNTLSTDKAVS